MGRYLTCMNAFVTTGCRHRARVRAGARWRIGPFLVVAIILGAGGWVSPRLTRPSAFVAGGRVSPLQIDRSHDGAFVSASQDEQTWSIGNSGIRVTLRLAESGDFVLDSVVNPVTGRRLTSAAGADSVVTVNGSATPLGSRSNGWTLEQVASAEVDNGAQLRFTFRLARPALTVVRSYACYRDAPVVETWNTYRAEGPAVTVSNPNPWQLVIPATAVHYSFGLRGDAAGLANDSAFTLQTASLEENPSVRLTELNRSTESFLPMLAADLPGDEFFGGLLWSGSWQIDVQRTGGGARVTVGLPRVDTSVSSARPFEAPRGFFGVVPGDRGDVSAALRAYVVNGIRRGRPFQPMVTYNTWFAHGTEIDGELMMEEAAVAASMGVELFVLDAGWYLGAGRGADFDSGLGTWEVDPARFPDGLVPLREYVHALGMQFGLWVEPERVDRATVDRPGLARDAWLASAGSGSPSGSTVQVCFASSAAREWVLDRLTRLLDEVRPDYLKWDNNYWVNCSRPGHGHGTADGNLAHVMGLYDVLALLKARYPDMTIENCSQGGNRLDFGMLRYTDTGWMDDRTAPAAHVRHNLQALMTFFPPAYLLSFVVDGVEPLRDPPDLPLFMRSRMPGILGLTYRGADLSEADREGVAGENALYKVLREVLRDASGVLLTEQVQTAGGPAWDAVQETSTSGDALVFAFQNDPVVPGVTIRLRNLLPDAAYLLSTADGTMLGRATGGDLMTEGIVIEASPHTAAHLRLVRRLP
jgi:alpha-galactosidase